MKTLLILLTLLPFSALADGHHGGWGHERWEHRGGYGYNNNWGDFAAGAIIGGIAGSIVAPRPYYPPQYYYPPPPPPLPYRPVWDAYCGCYINVPIYP